MRRALELAQLAELNGEVPVGSVLVLAGNVVGEGFNRTITDSDPSAHAEIVALRSAGQKLANYRLPGATLYVTLEPCCMCVGAMVHARVERLVFAAFDPKTGAAGSAIALLSDPSHNHQVRSQGGCLESEAAEQLRAFFRARRRGAISRSSE